MNVPPCRLRTPWISYHPEGGLVEQMMWLVATALYQCILYVEYADA